MGSLGVDDQDDKVSIFYEGSSGNVPVPEETSAVGVTCTRAPNITRLLSINGIKRFQKQRSFLLQRDDSSNVGFCVQTLTYEDVHQLPHCIPISIHIIISNNATVM